MAKRNPTQRDKKIGREVQRLDDERLAKLLASRRFCYCIPPDSFVAGFGYRVSIAIERKPGHFPTGSDAYLEGDASAQQPWFWGETFEEAQKICDEMNASHFGYTPKEAAIIVASTMGGDAKP